MGTMYKVGDEVVRLSTVKGSKVTLYAIWEPKTASITASVFSYDTALIFVGGAIVLLSIAWAIIYSKRKKKLQRKE